MTPAPPHDQERADHQDPPAGLRAAFDPHRYELTSFVFLRFLGLIYAVAFWVAELQLVPLVGRGGLEPAQSFLDQVHKVLGPRRAVLQLPTLFWMSASDSVLRAACHVGLVLSLLLVAGFGNAISRLALWAVYLSIVQVGQVFWGYGWESLLLETGFLAIFFGTCARVAAVGAAAFHPEAGDLALAVGALSSDVRRRPHQAARRSDDPALGTFLRRRGWEP